MTDLEKQKMKLAPRKRERKEASAEKLPEGAQGIDWRTKGVLGPVRNQGQMGNAYDFVALDEIEASDTINAGTKRNLSL